MKLRIEDVVKKEAGDEDEKGCPPADEIGQNAIPKTVQFPPGNVVTVSHDDDRDGHRAKILE
jgi:hypothetical protein